MTLPMFLIAVAIGFAAVIVLQFFRACSLLNERYDAGDDWDNVL